MIKFCRDYHNDEGKVEFVVGEVAMLDAESEDLMVRRNYADWHVADTDNAALEGADE